MLSSVEPSTVSCVVACFSSAGGGQDNAQLGDHQYQITLTVNATFGVDRLEMVTNCVNANAQLSCRLLDRHAGRNLQHYVRFGSRQRKTRLQNTAEFIVGLLLCDQQGSRCTFAEQAQRFREVILSNQITEAIAGCARVSEFYKYVAPWR